MSKFQDMAEEIPKDQASGFGRVEGGSVGVPLDEIPGVLRQESVEDQEGSTDPADRWAHRSQMMRCHSCMWYVEKARGPVAVGQLHQELGRCRKHSPTMGGFPVVYSNDWCGDHKIDENHS